MFPSKKYGVYVSNNVSLSPDKICDALAFSDLQLEFSTLGMLICKPDEISTDSKVDSFVLIALSFVVGNQITRNSIKFLCIIRRFIILTAQMIVHRKTSAE